MIAKTFAERGGLTGDDLIALLGLDDHGRKWQVRVELGQLDADATSQAVMSDLSALKSRLDFALRKEASRRWLPHVRRRMARIKTNLEAALQQFAQEIHGNPELRPAVIWSELQRILEAEVAVLKRRQLEYGAGLSRAEEQLRSTQADIEGALHSGGNKWFSRLKELVFAAVSRGVNLVTQVMTAERLVNDREEYAYLMDLGNAAITLLQEASGLAQAQLNQVMQVRTCVETALSQLERMTAAVQARLCAHPYAHLDETSLQQVALLQANTHTQVSVPLILSNLAAYVGADAAQLCRNVSSMALKQVRQQCASVTLPHLLEMRAAQLSGEAAAQDAGSDEEASRQPALRPNDLVLSALGIAVERASSPTLALVPEARPQAWWLVGVMDETNPGFQFGSSMLVSTRRRDQLQFLHVQTGLTTGQLADFEVANQQLDVALRERNFFVTSAMLSDASMLRVFALGLACGLVGLRRGGFAATAAHGADVALGPTPEQAMTTLAEQPTLTQHLTDVIEQLPPSELISRLEQYLSQTQQTPAQDDDVLWSDCADCVRERLTLAKQQLRFVAAPPVMQRAADAEEMNK
jgi:hypothetical protein